MNNKVIGIIAVIIGVLLIIWGYDVYDSAGSQINRTLGGSTPFKAWGAMVAGAICIIVGIIKVK